MIRIRGLSEEETSKSRKDNKYTDKDKMYFCLTISILHTEMDARLGNHRGMTYDTSKKENTTR
jgi:hypothetical protein